MLEYNVQIIGINIWVERFYGMARTGQPIHVLSFYK